MSSIVEVSQKTTLSAAAIPDFSAYGKVSRMWDRELNTPFYRYTRSGYKYRPSNLVKAGCYLWYENHHLDNHILYVGLSEDLHVRTYAEAGVNSGFLYQYIDEKLSEPFVPCSQYGISCDCIPRYFAVWIETAKFISLEKYLIDKYDPPLNKRTYRITEETRNEIFTFPADTDYAI